jgi:hypothetical protein
LGVSLKFLISKFVYFFLKKEENVVKCGSFMNDLLIIGYIYKKKEEKKEEAEKNLKSC